MRKISVILVSIVALAIFWYLLGAVLVLKNNENYVSKLQCVSYAPFSKEQSPFMFADGMVISEEQVRQDLVLLAKYTDCIRTYSVTGLEMIPKIARENGLKMLMGAWVSSDRVQTQAELEALVKLASQNTDIVKAVIVGNEVLLRGDTTPKVLKEHIEYVKNALPNIQVTYADVWEFWVRNQEIRSVTDFVTIHILPYWEDDPMNISRSIAHLADVRGEVEEILKDKNILIGETGWPSEGRMREDALPSKINQAIFVREFVQLAEKNNWDYNIIEAFDQPWKRESEGAVGGFWGLFDKDRGDKKILSGEVSNFVNYKALTCSSIALFLAFSFMLKNTNVGTKRVLAFGVFNTLFALLVTLQIEQYMVTVRTNFELLWAVLVLGIHLSLYFILLHHILKGSKPEIVNISAVLKQKKVNLDALTLLLFYASFIFVLLSSIVLAFEGRYRNFEIYIFLISLISYLWLYKEKFSSMNFGAFEKASALILVLTSLLIFINETYLNIFSDIWILISLGFAAMLYLASKKTEFIKLKNLAFFMLLFFAFFAYLRYGIVTNLELAQQCSIFANSFLCTLKAKFGVLSYLQVFGYSAVVSAVFAYFAENKIVSYVALFLSVGALLMMNAPLGAFAFVLSVFLLSN